MTFTFSGHETFSFRFSWLKKGIDAVTKDPEIFSGDRAMIELGTGKNMVRSIRHWCLASRLVEPDSLRDSRGRLKSTDLGRMIFDDNGFDPYLENPSTLWLIHWLISSNISGATTWFWSFGIWSSPEFTKESLVSGLEQWAKLKGHRTVSLNTLKRDVDCMIHTYCHSSTKAKTLLEETLDCPLTELGLISEMPDRKTYQFERGEQLSLPNEIFAFALTEFWQGNPDSEKLYSMAFEKVAYDPGSPGRIFKLDENSIIRRLEEMGQISDGAFYYDETAGLRQIYRRNAVESLQFLKKYYSSTRKH